MTQATMARPDAPRRTHLPLPLVLLVVVAAALSFGMTLALRGPDTVASVTLENPAPIALNVNVHSGNGGGALVLGTVPAQGSATHLDVLDQGDNWVFTFSAGGVDGGTVRVTRAKLAADGWRLEVPEAVVSRIEQGTFVPAYR